MDLKWWHYSQNNSGAIFMDPNMLWSRLSMGAWPMPLLRTSLVCTLMGLLLGRTVSVVVIAGVHLGVQRVLKSPRYTVMLRRLVMMSCWCMLMAVPKVESNEKSTG